NSIMTTQNGSTVRRSRKYYYQYYVCKQCNYKLDIHQVHEKLVLDILLYVQKLVNSETIKENSIHHLEQINTIILENIDKTDKQLDKLTRNGFIAKEHNDREFELLVHETQIDLLSDLNSFLFFTHKI